MSEPPVSGDKHTPRLDEELERDPGDETETADPDLWDTPGHDGIVSDDESDPDRTDLRSAIGTYVSLVPFPAQAGHLLATAEEKDAPDEILERLRSLPSDATYANTAELWDALDLGSKRRF